MRRAREAGMDLVEVAKNEHPPVCRIMDYGRFKYHQKKKAQKHHEQQLKEVRLRPKTDDNDRAIKLNRALKFLSKGDKVQFTMQFRGRERAHREVGVIILRRVVDDLGELVKVERPPGMDGRHMIMIVAPVKPEFQKLEKEGLKPKLADLAARRAKIEAARPATKPEGAAPPSAPEPADASATQA
jgi:translation initiation factor IF-3